MYDINELRISSNKEDLC